MFTGIIEATGQIKAIEKQNQGLTLHIETPFRDLILGESVAVNGVCLTVTRLVDKEAYFFVSSETLNKTNLSHATINSNVNLERALLPTARLSGHLVQGHVDGQASLLSIKAVGDAYELQVRIPQNFLKYTVEKGSITLDGISLTINRIDGDILFFMIIPHTWNHTALHDCTSGHRLNFEVDIIAKYAERLCTPYLK